MDKIMLAVLILSGALVVVLGCEMEESKVDRQDYTDTVGHSDDSEGRREWKSGDVVKDYYSLKDTNGSLREVHYKADGKGITAILAKDWIQVNLQPKGIPPRSNRGQQSDAHPPSDQQYGFRQLSTGTYYFPHKFFYKYG